MTVRLSHAPGVTTGGSGTGTDNRIVRWDGTNQIQDSLVTINDNGTMVWNSPTNTSGNLIDIQESSLSNGRLAFLSSNSSSTSAHQLVQISNINVSGTGAVPLGITQASTNTALQISGAWTDSVGVSIIGSSNTTSGDLTINNLSSGS